MKKCCLTLIYSLLLITSKLFGQDLETSHLIWNISSYNQGALTGNNNAHVTFDYRQSVLSGNINYSNSLFWMDYPILRNGVNTGAFYFSLENQTSGSENKFNTFKSNVGLSKKISINRDSYLSFGLGVEYQQQTLSLDNLTTGSQFMQGLGFNRALENGESSSFYRATFFAINSGLYLFARDPQLTRQLSVGLSINNINKPIKNWDGISSTLPSLWSGQFQYLSFIRSKLALGPDAFVFKEGNNFNALGGATLRYYLGQSLSGSFDEEYDHQYLTVFARFSTQQMVILGLQYHQKNYAAGISTDFPFGSLNYHYRNGFELFFSYIPKINGKSRTKKQRKQKEIEKQENEYKNTSIKKAFMDEPGKPGEIKLIDDILELATESQTNNNHGDSTSLKTKMYPGELLSTNAPVKNSFSPVYFIFNSSELDEKSKAYLLEIYQKYLSMGRAKIMLTGHTDNIGTDNVNLVLSINRAEKVKEHLINLGVNPTVISVDGKGESEPTVPNITPENRAKNRRVELQIIPN